MALITQSENPHIVKLHEQVKEATPHLNETEQARLTAAAGVEVQKRGFNAANLGDLECYECKGRQLLNMEDLGKQARNPYTSSATVDIAQAVQTPVQESLTQMHNVQLAQTQAQEQNQQQGRGISL